MTDFTPIASFLGGMLIGLSAIFLMLTNGKIAGISGILSRILPPNASKQGVSVGIAFMVGLLLATPIYQLIAGSPADQVVSSNFVLLIIAGLLVGFGSVLGSGCTSGHGVCGISRLSQRSIAGTLVFMATGFIAVFVLRHVLGQVGGM